MKNILQNRFLFRWLTPITLSVIFVVLLTRRSVVPHVFSRYSENYFLILLTFGIWTLTCWWVIIDHDRYHRFLNRIFKYHVFSILTITVGVLMIVDLFFDLIGFIYIVFIGFAVIIWFFSVSNPKEWINRIALIITSVIISFLFLEGIFRLVILESKVPDTKEGFVKRFSSSWPHHIPVEKKSNSFRILGLCDSFGLAGGHSNYHYFLEELLKNDSLNVEVVNLSISGIGPYDELEIFKRFGAQYQPDLVLHGFFVGNDFAIAESKGMQIYRGISVRPSAGVEALRPRNFTLFRWLSRLLVVLRDKQMKEAEKIARKNNSVQVKTENDTPSGSFSTKEFLRIERQRMGVCLVTGDPNMRWRKTSEILDEIQKSVNQSGAKYVLMIHPDQFQIENDLQRQLQQTYDLNLADYDFGMPQRFLKDYSAYRGIPCLDLFTAFREKGIDGGLYQLNDTHYNKEGNKLVAHMVAEFLQDEHLITPKK